MKQGETKDLKTLRVEGVTAAATADGRVALLLHLKDQTIGLEMNQQRVDEMRKQLAAIETFLRRKTGKTGQA